MLLFCMLPLHTFYLMYPLSFPPTLPLPLTHTNSHCMFFCVILIPRTFMELSEWRILAFSSSSWYMCSEKKFYCEFQKTDTPNVVNVSNKSDPVSNKMKKASNMTVHFLLGQMYTCRVTKSTRKFSWNIGVRTLLLIKDRSCAVAQEKEEKRMRRDILFSSSQITVQKSHYPPANHHAIHLKNVLFPGRNHLLTTGADGPRL